MPDRAMRIASLSSVLAFILSGAVASAQAAEPDPRSGISPALCGRGDIREPGIQGEVPAGQTPNYNCGVKLVGQLPIEGAVQGAGKCAYIRPRGKGGTPDESRIHVVDVSNPARPVVVGSPLPVHNGSESMRVVVTKARAVLVSGSSVFDISNCLKPQRMGEINWPNTRMPGVSRKNLPHDIRVNRAGTKVIAATGVWEVDISDLRNPSTWKVIDHRCDVMAQIAGPHQQVHRQAIAVGRSLCDDAAKPAPQGANYSMGGSILQGALLWPQLSHAPDFNADDTRLYIGDQAGGTQALWAPESKVRIIDLTKRPFAVVGEVRGAGHGLDWFRVGDRDYVIHSNEGGSKGVNPGQPDKGDPCHPHPRPTKLAWGFDAQVSDVTIPGEARNVSMVTLAINEPQFCERRKATGRDPWIAYHLIDNPLDAKFTVVNFGEAGLRIFDIRNPLKPIEVAYFNHGPPVHASVGHYDPSRHLIYFSDAEGFKVLQIEPQVRVHLRL